MAPEEFKKIWEEDGYELVNFVPSQLDGLNLKPSTIDFFVQAGLPGYAEPNLLLPKKNGVGIETIYKLTDQWERYLDQDDNYVVIGNCRDGDLIAINIKHDDRIEQLDHEDLFRPMFFNSSINIFANFLTIYKEFESMVMDEIGNLSDFQFGDRHFNFLSKSMAKVDPPALDKGSFWGTELEMLLRLRIELNGNKQNEQSE